MRVDKQDYKKGFVSLKIENLDDLWYLSNIIEKNDLVSSITFRKIKIGDTEDRKTSIVKKKVYITLSAEKVEFSKYSDTLRISGVITEAPEDIPRGSHHTINAELGSEIKIIKEEWLNYQKQKIKESTKTNPTNILVCTFDREQAHLFKITQQGYEHVHSLSGDVQKKMYETKNTTNFYKEIINSIKETDKKQKSDHIIMASPAFYKDELKKNIEGNELNKKIVFATCSDASKNAITEVMRRPELKNVLEKDRVSKEVSLVEDLLKNISKNQKNVYGLEQTQKAASSGAVQTLLVSDKLIQRLREQENFEKLEKTMKIVDQSGGEVKIISADHQGGEKLEGLGGIGATLRYEI
ncbi:mRNA surveillance protein pelota [Candidatus Woesearchaeota archaeon]|nr:mRNA surveillance protein pelota [Candidatus Woesearchaeota archaeon]